MDIFLYIDMCIMRERIGESSPVTTNKQKYTFWRYSSLLPILLILLLFLLRQIE
jgi:hypothetical protein